MSGLGAYMRRWASDVWHRWDRFWFTPADAATLALIRICAGAMLLYTHLVWSLELEAFFAPDGWISPRAVYAWQGNSFSWSYFWWIESRTVLWIVHIAALVVFGMLMLGLYSRVASVLAFLAALSYVGRVPGSLFGLDQINIMLAMYLMVGACGDAWSLDRWRVRRRQDAPLSAAAPKVSTNIAIRLIQLHMCIIYLFAGMSKLTGQTWWDGTAMWIALANLEYQSLDMTWMANWPRLINALTHVTVFWEVYYCALIWPRPLRPVMLALAVPLHLGIAVCLGMITFGLIMLVGNAAFIPPEVVRAVIERRRDAGQGRAGEPAGSSHQRRSVPASARTR